MQPDDGERRQLISKILQQFAARCKISGVDTSEEIAVYTERLDELLKGKGNLSNDTTQSTKEP